MKKIILIVFLIILFGGYYFYDKVVPFPLNDRYVNGVIYSESNKTSSLQEGVLKDNVEEHDSKKNIYTAALKKEINISDNKVLSKDLPENEELPSSAIANLSADTKFLSDPMADIGFSKKGINAVISNNPKSLLSIEDMPRMLKETLKVELEKNKINGYDEVSDVDADSITGIMNLIAGDSNSTPNITFSMSRLPESIVRNYEYIGYTFPNYPAVNDPSVKNNTIRRVFHRHDASSLLIVEESSLLSGGATLIKEFVNMSVGGQPAIYAIKKSSSGKTYAMLNWTTSEFGYSLYQVGSLADAREILGHIGSELTRENYKDDSSGEKMVPEDAGMFEPE